MAAFWLYRIKPSARGDLAVQKSGYWFTFGEIENAMFRAFYVDKGAVLPTVLRGRINALQRGGLVPAKTGSGNAVRYGLTDAYELALGLELANLGCPPKIILRNVTPGLFETFLREMDRLPDTMDHLLWVFHPSALCEERVPQSSHLMVWKLNIGSSRIPFSFIAIDVTEIRGKIDAALEATMSRGMSRGAA